MQSKQKKWLVHVIGLSGNSRRAWSSIPKCTILQKASAVYLLKPIIFYDFDIRNNEYTFDHIESDQKDTL